MEDAKFQDDDPHASKVDPNDPRLAIDRPKGRRLKKGPIALLIGLGALAIVLAISVELMPSESPIKEAEDQPPTTQYAMPDILRSGPQSYADIPVPEPEPAPLPPPAPLTADVPTLGPPLPGDLGAAMIAQPTAPATAPHEPSPDEIERERLRKAALAAGPFFDGSAVSNAGSASAQPDSVAEQIRMLREQATPGGALSASDYGGAGQVTAASDGPNMQGEKRNFINNATGPKNAYLQSRLIQPVSPYEVKAGTVIPTTLITGLNSDLPGPVVAQVRENVYDTVSGNHLLIPQGTRAIGQYDSAIAYGQERVLVVWSRLIFPNGTSIDLEGMQGVDLSGFAGYADRVDHHWMRLIGGVVLSSLLSAGANASQGDVDGFQPSVSQDFAQNIGSNINQAGQAITQKNLSIQPTITVRPGYSVNIMVQRDMILVPFVGEH